MVLLIGHQLSWFADKNLCYVSFKFQLGKFPGKLYSVIFFNIHDEQIIMPHPKEESNNRAQREKNALFAQHLL